MLLVNTALYILRVHESHRQRNEGCGKQRYTRRDRPTQFAQCDRAASCRARRKALRTFDCRGISLRWRSLLDDPQTHGLEAEAPSPSEAGVTQGRLPHVAPHGAEKWLQAEATGRPAERRPDTKNLRQNETHLTLTDHDHGTHTLPRTPGGGRIASAIIATSHPSAPMPCETPMPDTYKPTWMRARTHFLPDRRSVPGMGIGIRRRPTSVLVAATACALHGNALGDRARPILRRGTPARSRSEALSLRTVS